MFFFRGGGGGSEINNILNQVFREIGKEVLHTEKKHKQTQATNFSKKSLNDFSPKNKTKAKKSNSKDLTLFDNKNTFQNNGFNNTKRNKKNKEEEDLFNWLVEDNLFAGDNFEKQFFKQGKNSKGGQSFQKSWQSDDGFFSSSFQTFEFDLSSGASKVKKNKKNNLFEDVVIDEPGKKSKKRQPVIIEAKNDAKYDF